MKKILPILFVCLAAFFALFAWKCGFYSIEPIGAVPEGTTWVVWREADEPFFESADALCLRKLGSVSLMARGIALGKAPKDRIIFKLPYWRFAYLRSTNGQEFDR